MKAIPPSRALPLCVVMLLAGGVIMSLASSPYMAVVLDHHSVWYFFLRQSAWSVLGIVAFLVAAWVKTERLRKLRYVLFVGAIGLLVMVLLPGFGKSMSGSARWIGTGSISIQPSEVMKLAWVIFAADLTARRAGSDRPAKEALFPVVGLLTLTGGLIMLQPDLGTTMVIVGITFVLLLGSGVRGRAVAGTAAGFMAAGAVLAVAAPYRRERLLSFLHPFSHAQTAGYQVAQSLISLGTGHTVGVGFGQGTAYWGFLPQANTDFIFSTIGQQTGIVGALVVLGLLAFLTWTGFRVAQAAPNRFEALLALGITAWIGGETILNIGTSLGVLPVTGVPLPLISYGGSALVATMAGLGILYDIAVHGERGLRTVADGGSGRTRAGAAAKGTGRADSGARSGTRRKAAYARSGAAVAGGSG